MKRTFYQLHFGFLLSILIYIFFIVVGLYCISLSFVDKKIFLFFVGLIPTIIFSYNLIGVIYYRIIFFENKILITGELCNKKYRTQFKDEILYSDIDKIDIIYVNKNSNKKPLKEVSFNSLRPRLYFNFTLKNKDTKWVHISHFSKRQKEKMINIINNKANLNLSYNQLKKNDLSYYKRKK